MATTIAVESHKMIETPDIAIEEQNRTAVVAILNKVLADAHLLYMKTRNYHWNVTGMQFHDLHKFLEDQYELLAVSIDDVAERARSLGGQALGTLCEMIENSQLDEKPGDRPDGQTMIGNLLKDHETIIRSLREFVDDADNKYEDMGTSDFLCGLMESHEKMAWMLRAFLA